VVTTTPTKPTTVTYKHQSLINDLQKLVTDKVFMKVGSQGTRVGTVQTFLNIYNNTSKRVDNDFGAGTKTDLIVFQKAEKITADGEAGPATFQKMIDWLKKQ
jgi:peptidoglycan hydrolase-like protein with peptidoglycan-binding domain